MSSELIMIKIILTNTHLIYLKTATYIEKVVHI